MNRGQYLARLQDVFEFYARQRNPRFVHVSETNFRFFACEFEDRYLDRFKVRGNRLVFVDDRGRILITRVLNGFIIIRVKKKAVSPQTVGWILDQGFQEI